MLGEGRGGRRRCWAKGSLGICNAAVFDHAGRVTKLFRPAFRPPKGRVREDTPARTPARPLHTIYI